MMNRPIYPKDSTGPVRVLFLGRISRPNQNIENIDASYDEVKRMLASLYNGPLEYRCFGEQGSGWNLKRRTILEAEEEIRTGRWDLVMMEDLGRAYRNPQFQYRIAHMCVDHRTRLICHGDGIDTAEENWEAILGAAVLRHGMQVPETRRRVKRSATYAFHHGGMVIKIKFGYRKLTAEEAASGRFGPKDLRMAKVPDAAPYIEEIRSRILRRESYASIAEWLTVEGVPTGPCCKSKVWEGRHVVDLMRAPILHGKRQFRVKLHELVYETGEHRRDDNPEPEVEIVPELAFMTEQEQIDLWNVMDHYAPPRDTSPRKKVARKESYWPGQHLRCSACRGLCYWCPANRLKCCNARPGVETPCWNQTLVDADQIRDKVLPVLLDAIQQRPELKEILVNSITQEFQRQFQKENRRSDDLQTQVRELERRRDRITQLLIEAEESEGLLNQLRNTEQALIGARQSLAVAVAEKQQQPLYHGCDDVEEHLLEIMLNLARHSYPFSALMRRTFGPMDLVPIQALDTAQVHPRIKLSLPPLPGQTEPTLLTIDAFEQAKPHANVRTVRELQRENPGKSILWISQQLNIAWEIADRASKYAKIMEDLGTEDLYVELKTAPEKASRWRKQSLADGQKKLPSADSSPNPDADDPLDLPLAG